MIRRKQLCPSRVVSSKKNNSKIPPNGYIHFFLTHFFLLIFGIGTEVDSGLKASSKVGLIVDSKIGLKVDLKVGSIDGLTIILDNDFFTIVLLIYSSIKLLIN